MNQSKNNIFTFDGEKSLPLVDQPVWSLWRLYSTDVSFNHMAVSGATNSPCTDAWCGFSSDATSASQQPINWTYMQPLLSKVVVSFKKWFELRVIWPISTKMLKYTKYANGLKGASTKESLASDGDQHPKCGPRLWGRKGKIWWSGEDQRGMLQNHSSQPATSKMDSMVGGC